MNNVFRNFLTLAVLAAAAASQALILDFAGTGSRTPAADGTFSFVTTGYAGPKIVDQFGFISGITTPSTQTIVLTNPAGSLALKFSGTAVTPDLFAGTAFVVPGSGTGLYTGYTGTNIGITRNKVVTYEISIQGNISPVPEPASLCALGVGAVALLRRRKKA